MKIEKPGFYTTKDGRKVEIQFINESGFCIGEARGCCVLWSTQGYVIYSPWSGVDHGNMAIASEWKEPRKPVSVWVAVDACGEIIEHFNSPLAGRYYKNSHPTVEIVKLTEEKKPCSC